MEYPMTADQPTSAGFEHPPGYAEAVQAILKPTDDIRKENANTRRLVKWIGLVAGIALLGVIIAGLALWRGYDDRWAQDRHNKAEIAQQALNQYNQAVAQCKAGNAYRAADFQSWQFVIALPAQPNETPAEKATRVRNIAAFEAFKKKQDAQVNCSKIPVPPTALPALKLQAPPHGTTTTSTTTTTVGFFRGTPTTIPVRAQPPPPTTTPKKVSPPPRGATTTSSTRPTPPLPVTTSTTAPSETCIPVAGKNICVPITIP